MNISLLPSRLCNKPSFVSPPAPPSSPLDFPAEIKPTDADTKRHGANATPIEVDVKEPTHDRQTERSKEQQTIVCWDDCATDQAPGSTLIIDDIDSTPKLSDFDNPGTMAKNFTLRRLQEIATEMGLAASGKNRHLYAHHAVDKSEFR